MDIESSQKLTYSIPSRASLGRLCDEELESLRAQHEYEITKITGQISVSYNKKWITSAKQARRILLLHKSWIEREQRCRQADAKAALREANKAFTKEMMSISAASKEERIRLSNDEKMRQVDVFKTVVREVVGEEMYMHIWQLAQQRIGV